jgi:hypothetical protein
MATTNGTFTFSYIESGTKKQIDVCFYAHYSRSIFKYNNNQNPLFGVNIKYKDNDEFKKYFNELKPGVQVTQLIENMGAPDTEFILEVTKNNNRGKIETWGIDLKVIQYPANW